MTESNALGTQASRLFEAHVGFEMERWRGQDAPARRQALVEAFWDWASQTALASVCDADTVAAAAIRLALDIPVPDRLAGVIGALADELVRLDTNRETRVQDVIDETLFEEGVSLTVELESLRNRLIQRALQSPVYKPLASDVLYQGIKDYIFSDSGAIRSIPGASSFIKGSSSAINKRLPGLEAQVEKRVRAYIEKNTAKTLERSEKLLLDSLDEDRIRSIAAELWASIHDKPLAVDDVIDADEIQRLVDFGVRVWQELRETEYLGELVSAGVRTYFQHHGKRTLADLLGDVGVDSDVLHAEAETLAPAIIQGFDETGLLERLVRLQLEPFYRSETFEAALAGNG